MIVTASHPTLGYKDWMMALQTAFVATPTTLPASITAPPTIQFTPPPECYDPASNWIVSEKCWLNLGAGTTSPDWLTCSHTRFGPPVGQQSLCDVPRSADFRMAPKTTQDGVVSYYSGCPVGLSENATLVQRGWNVRSYGGNLGDYDATGTIIAIPIRSRLFGGGRRVANHVYVARRDRLFRVAGPNTVVYGNINFRAVGQGDRGQDRIGLGDPAQAPVTDGPLGL
ncbi:hypothetical protein NUW58_g796 [Xylaria curta]|uniref:Uncharacterized protein n=1 Tax=Xylaria curta TaxID=42375 RepID=A0ACC1PQN1_9PEZI|nr:hypothetical protein NUW58_g796 [Xylaria curta]